MAELSRGWSAGFLDGEGSILVYQTKYSFQLVVKAAQIDLQPLHRLRGYYGGSISTRKPVGNLRQVSDWKVVSRAAYLFLKSVEPLLTCKREQAKVAIEFYELRQGMPQRLSSEQKQILSSYRTKLQEMKSGLA